MVNLLASGIGNIIVSVLLALLILLVMICVHEFGHFAAGRILGFRINEFAIGFGPALFKKKGKKHGTVFSLRAFPLGGFCAFDGEDDEKNSPDSFNSKKPWQRIIVLISGALMNYILALLLVAVGFFAFGQPCYKIDDVAESAEYSAEYSLKSGDVIIALDGVNVYFATDVISALKGKTAGDGVTADVIRDGERSAVQIALRADCDFKNSSDLGKAWSALGVATHERENGNLYWSISASNCNFGFFPMLGRSFVYTFRTAGAIFRVLGELVSGSLGIESMGGPITTIKITSQMAAQGFQSFLQVAAYIGVNLAVFNLLPIPSLDGSKVVFCLIEWIFKKPVPRKIEAIIHAVGLAAILIFAITVDILQFARC